MVSKTVKVIKDESSTGLPEIDEFISMLGHRFKDHGIKDYKKVALIAAEQIMEFWGGFQFYIPKGHSFRMRRKDAEVIEDYKAGMRQNDLAKKYNISAPHVYEILDRNGVRERHKRTKNRKSELVDN